MSLFWLLFTIWAIGAFGGWGFVMISVDSDWTFSQMGLSLAWPLALIWLIIRGCDPRKLPEWFERHWG